MLGARDERGAAYTDEEIYGNVLTMLLAGEDTTANTMAWMLHFLIEHPQVQGRMRTEAAQVVNGAGMLTQLQDAERLNYIEAVAHETMRLKPVAPIIFLESSEEVEIGDVTCPPGTALMLLTLHGGLQESNFVSADEFRPERWLEAAPASSGAHNTRAFVPFGAGPRFCPGRQLAIIEIKVVMAMLSTGFEVAEVEQGKPVGELFSFTMMPKNLLARFSRRIDLDAPRQQR
jgi:cytochrome P450